MAHTVCREPVIEATEDIIAREELLIDVHSGAIEDIRYAGHYHLPGGNNLDKLEVLIRVTDVPGEYDVEVVPWMELFSESSEGKCTITPEGISVDVALATVHRDTLCFMFWVPRTGGTFKLQTRQQTWDDIAQVDVYLEFEYFL